MMGVMAFFEKTADREPDLLGIGLGQKRLQRRAR